ncbi:histone deacetylase 6-like [Pyrus ussuriensis x Pyrus communis]|uniref:Histone deacetylase 6-like n=1 Tax=Pyrus ussuriensis x Pyrus communis TaxID=2448454 RepID=A0A5N5FET1_9ROSA|nr:histone deacetylase 6-like [Pyrus ussuriensis x Pyrus communis]
MFLKVGSGIDEGKLQELGVDQRREQGAGDRRRKGWGIELHRLCSGDKGEEVNVVFGVEVADVDGVGGKVDLHPPPMSVDLHPKGDNRQCILAGGGQGRRGQRSE